MVIEVVAERPWGISAVWVRALLARAGRAADLATPARTLSVAFVGAATSARLNRRYRRRRGPTNILSFPLGGDEAAGTLGELILCVPLAKAEARRYGRTFRSHLALLLIHGYLHLLGFDHQRPAARARMERLEGRLLAKTRFPTL